MITAADLYCMAMESDTAYRLMPQLCQQLGVPIERVKKPDDEAQRIQRDLMPDPFSMGMSAPMTLTN